MIGRDTRRRRSGLVCPGPAHLCGAGLGSGKSVLTYRPRRSQWRAPCHPYAEGDQVLARHSELVWPRAMATWQGQNSQQGRLRVGDMSGRSHGRHSGRRGGASGGLAGGAEGCRKGWGSRSTLQAPQVCSLHSLPANSPVTKGPLRPTESFLPPGGPGAAGPGSDP